MVTNVRIDVALINNGVSKIANVCVRKTIYSRLVYAGNAGLKQRVPTMLELTVFVRIRNSCLIFLV